MARFTRPYLRARLARAVEALGIDPAPIRLDFNSAYGGYDVTEKLDGGGERSLIGNGPFGARMSGAELDAWISGVLYCAERNSRRPK